MNVLHELAELDALLEGRQDISDNGGPNTAMMVRQVLATALPAIASLIESENIARGMVDASWMDRARQAEKQLAAAHEALAEMTADRDSWCDQASARVKDWHEAREALQAAKADAARYRWLKCGGWEVMQDPSMWPEYLKFDGAIDAARGVAVVLVPRKEGPALPLRGERARDKGETFGHIETDATLQRDRQL